MQVQDPVHVLFVVEYIRALVTKHLEPISDVDRLGTSPKHVHILGINKHMLKVLYLQFLSQCSRPSFMHQGILNKVVCSLWASKAVVLEVDFVGRPSGQGFTQSSTSQQAGHGQAKVFTLTPQDAQTSNAMVAGTLSV